MICSPETVNSRIEACREQYEVWRLDPNLAVQLCDRRDVLLAEMVGIFDAVERIDDWCRSEIRNAPNEDVQSLDQAEMGLKDMWSAWLKVAEDIAVTMENHGFRIENESDFAKRLSFARKNRDHDFELGAIEDLASVNLPPISAFESVLRPLEEFPD